MLRPYDRVEEIAHRVITAAIEVHRVLGAGLLESVYRECLIIELRERGLRVRTEVGLPIDYKGHVVRPGLRLDLLVEECIIVELKAIEALHPVHEAQVITYLKLANCPAGLLLNFNEVLLKHGLRRLDHPDRYRIKQKNGRKEEH